ncbi:hypothetical protein KPH14_000817 [Odynerus spinipes]|uniref:Reverse transcriptase/retrotransposon-derived protein RNase H-like domain-containing protein n=1 Tax=Odynerus spinipes TaxID=1348599 RepID=A0AAD9R8Y0_9HYME|nr:hypothetical protein KPH14_000817 [Odynerus spinipes]
MNYYHRFIKDVAAQQAPLSTLLKGSRRNDKCIISWSEQTIKASEACKQGLANSALLAHPKDSVLLIISTDASDTAIGTSFEQSEEELCQPIAFFSRKLTPTQRRCSTYDLELLAI